MLNRSKTYLALGDSFTIGEAVDPHLRWPVQLARMLREEGFALEEPRLIATTGWTTGELMAGMAASDLETGFDLVSLLIGVNNQYRGYPLEPYQADFEALLRQAIELGGNNPRNVLVLSIPDWGMTPFARQDPRSSQEIRAQVSSFNEINRTISEKFGAEYVDVFPISQQGYEDPGMIAPDGLHPSGEQYRLWARAVFPAAHRILS